MLVMLGLCCWRSLLELPQWRKSMSQDETRCYLRQIVRESEVAQLCPDSVRPHGLQPTRLLRPWEFPGKNTGVDCHCLLRILLVNRCLYEIYQTEPYSVNQAITLGVAIFFIQISLSLVFNNVFCFVFTLTAPGLSCGMQKL